MAANAGEIFRLAGKDDAPLLVITVIQRTDADGVTGSDEIMRFGIIDDARKFCIEHGEHFRAVCPPEGEENLAVGIALECVLPGKLRFHRLEAIELAVADDCIIAQ